jgi:hypothetical protein
MHRLRGYISQNRYNFVSLLVLYFVLFKIVFVFMVIPLLYFFSQVYNSLFNLILKKLN